MSNNRRLGNSEALNIARSVVYAGGAAAAVVLTFGSGGAAAPVLLPVAAKLMAASMALGAADAMGQLNRIHDVRGSFTDGRAVNAYINLVNTGASSAGGLMRGASSVRTALQALETTTDIASLGSGGQQLAHNWERMSGAERGASIAQLAFWGGMFGFNTRRMIGNLEGPLQTNAPDRPEPQHPMVQPGNPALAQRQSPEQRAPSSTTGDQPPLNPLPGISETSPGDIVPMDLPPDELALRRFTTPADNNRRVPSSGSATPVRPIESARSSRPWHFTGDYDVTTRTAFDAAYDKYLAQEPDPSSPLTMTASQWFANFQDFHTRHFDDMTLAELAQMLTASQPPANPSTASEPARHPSPRVNTGPTAAAGSDYPWQQQQYAHEPATQAGLGQAYVNYLARSTEATPMTPQVWFANLQAIKGENFPSMSVAEFALELHRAPEATAFETAQRQSTGEPGDTSAVHVWNSQDMQASMSPNDRADLTRAYTNYLAGSREASPLTTEQWLAHLLEYRQYHFPEMPLTELAKWMYPAAEF